MTYATLDISKNNACFVAPTAKNSGTVFSLPSKRTSLALFFFYIKGKPKVPFGDCFYLRLGILEQSAD